MLYNIAIYIYLTGVAIMSLFDKKVRAMWQGERAAFDTLRRHVDKGARYVWFHAASLGEFEQGRPIMERLRKRHPEYKVLLTFFSPSGYEVRKDYKGADIVCYLPLDTPKNAKRFLSMIQPEMAFFIKYEFWYNYLKILKQRGTPVYSVSSIFRPNQIFFRPYAREYSKVLRCVTHFFVQNTESRQLLAKIGIENVTVTGDTRFDRVMEIKGLAQDLPVVEAFARGKHVFIAGSSWAPDEDIFIPYFKSHPDWRLIIAPHVISEEHIGEIMGKLSCQAVRYSQTDAQEAARAQCLVIDCFGVLSSAYRYGDVAYVGGGFGVGIHNILEPAVWGMPVFFGPNNHRFQEAQNMKAGNGGYEIATAADFNTRMDTFIAHPETIAQAGTLAATFVKSKAGATDKVMAAVGL